MDCLFYLKKFGGQNFKQQFSPRTWKHFVYLANNFLEFFGEVSNNRLLIFCQILDRCAPKYKVRNISVWYIIFIPRKRECRSFKIPRICLIFKKKKINYVKWWQRWQDLRKVVKKSKNVFDNPMRSYNLLILSLKL